MRNIVIGTAGHIDHGKSALVRVITGIDPDRLKEEKERGITIDLGFAHLRTDDFTFAFVDVPGHERFVRNMLAGVSGIDYVLFVVAADESVMPQTREHFDICRLLSLSGGVIALTKADLVDRETLELVQLEMRELVKGSFLNDAPMIPVSARTGDGLDLLLSELVKLSQTFQNRIMDGPVRLPIDRAFSVKGFGAVITGTLVSGRVNVDDELEILPSGTHVKVRGLQAHGERKQGVEMGQRTAINLSGIDFSDLNRGDSLVTPNCFTTTRQFDVILELLEGVKPLRHGSRIRFHQGTSEILGRVAFSTKIEEQSDKFETVAMLLPGSCTHARFRLESPMVLTRGDRFIVRAYSPPVTIGGGEVIDPQPPRSGIRTSSTRTRLERLGSLLSQNSVSSENAVEVILQEREALGLSVRELTTRVGVVPNQVEDFLKRFVQAGQAVLVGDFLVSTGALLDLSTRLLEELDRYHQAHPLSDGIPREEAREKIFSGTAQPVFEYVLEQLVGSKEIITRDRVALASHRISLSLDEIRARDVIERLFRDGGLKPPDTTALASTIEMPPEIVDRILQLLIRQKVLVRLNSLVFHADVLSQLKIDMAELKASSIGSTHVNVATFKERHGITRKYAIPLLEYLDRERLTRRVGDVRILL